jgi:Tol biopolymer transport system component
LNPRKASVLVILALLITVGFFAGLLELPAPPVLVSSSSPIQITHGVATRTDIAVSPNGRFIAYSSNQSGAFSIWFSTISGAELTRITAMSGDQVLPQWDPLGNTISFIWKHGSFSDLCLVGTNSSSHVCITSDKHVQDYAWSANGLIIAYDDKIEGNIHLYHVATGLDTLFVFNGTAMDPTFGINTGVLYFSASTGNGFNI